MFSKFNVIKVEDVYIHCLGLDVRVKMKRNGLLFLWTWGILTTK